MQRRTGWRLQGPPWAALFIFLGAACGQAGEVGSDAAVDGKSETVLNCTVNGECFGGGGCYEDKCVDVCPYTGSPRETPTDSAYCSDPHSERCCIAGERCCPKAFSFEAGGACLPGDGPCWPRCPGEGDPLICAPDTFCPGGDAADTATVPSCSDVGAPPDGGMVSSGYAGPFGIDPSASCLEQCPAERRCGAQTCCAPGTVCFTVPSGSPIPADGDPGVGNDIDWTATPAGGCCVP